MNGNFAGSIGSALNNGTLTVGGASTGVTALYLFNNEGALTINSAIVDNAAGGRTRLVLTPFNNATTTLVGANSFTGGTQFNGGASHTGTLALNVAGANGSSIVAIPLAATASESLIINRATVRLDAASQIHEPE